VRRHTSQERFPFLQQFGNKLSVALDLKLEGLCLHLLRTPDFQNLDGMWVALIHSASENGYAELLECLIKRNPPGLDSLVNNKDAAKQTPLYKAARNGYTKVVEQLLDKGAHVDEKGDKDRVPLHEAAAHGHPEVVKLLLSKGAKVDGRDKARKTPLHEAAAHGHNTVIEILLSRGGHKVLHRTDEAKSHETEYRGYGTAVATSHESEPATFAPPKVSDDPKQPSYRRRMIEAEDDLNRTPLHYAAKEGHFRSVLLLLSLEAPPDSKDADGKSPLYLAAENGRLEAVQELLNGGAYYRTADKNGRSIITMLMTKEQAENADEEAKERLTEIKRIFRGLSRSRELYNQTIRDSEEVDGPFTCAIINFGPGVSRRYGKHRKHSVHSVINGNVDVFKEGTELAGLTHTWLHLPVNNVSSINFHGAGIAHIFQP
jgi:ankyrin repeat protein